MESPDGVRLLSHFLARVQAPHWRGQKKKKNRRVWGGGRAIAGLASLADIFSYLTPFFAFSPQLRSLFPGYSFFFRFLFSEGVLLSALSSRNLSCTVLSFRVGVGFTSAAKLAFCGLRLSVPTSYVAPTLAGGGAARFLEHKKQTS